MNESPEAPQRWAINEFLASSKTLAQHLYDIYRHLGLTPPPEVYSAIERTLGVTFDDLVGTTASELHTELAKRSDELADLRQKVDELQINVLVTVEELRDKADHLERTLPRRLWRRG